MACIVSNSCSIVDVAGAIGDRFANIWDSSMTACMTGLTTTVQTKLHHLTCSEHDHWLAPSSQSMQPIWHLADNHACPVNDQICLIDNWIQNRSKAQTTTSCSSAHILVANEQVPKLLLPSMFVEHLFPHGDAHAWNPVVAASNTGLICGSCPFVTLFLVLKIFPSPFGR